MTASQRPAQGWRDNLLFGAYGIALIAQFVLLFTTHHARNPVILGFGYAIWGLSCLFGVLPMLVLKRSGSVPQGQAYVNTTTLVTGSVYGLVRHPQYLAGILLSIGLALLTQHWVSTLLVLPVYLGIEIDARGEDRRCEAFFGEAYREYMARVPRLDLVLGIWRALRAGAGDAAH